MYYSSLVFGRVLYIPDSFFGCNFRCSHGALFLDCYTVLSRKTSEVGPLQNFRWAWRWYGTWRLLKCLGSIACIGVAQPCFCCVVIALQHGRWCCCFTAGWGGGGEPVGWQGMAWQCGIAMILCHKFLKSGMSLRNKYFLPS